MNNNTIKLRRNPVIDDGFIILTVVGLLVVTVVYLAFRNQLSLFLAFGIIFYLGFGLPLWMEYAKKRKLALENKKWEQQKWGFYGRDRDGPWVAYVQNAVVKKEVDCAKGKFFYSEWLIINDGIIVVNPGKSKVNQKAGTVSYAYKQKTVYAWDGCTPKRFFFWLAMVGTPDWRRHEEPIIQLTESGQFEPKIMFWPKAIHASLVHDALYQYIDRIPLSKNEVDKLFREMLLDSQLPSFIAYLYYLAVTWFGARDIKDPTKAHENTALTCKNPPG